MTLMTHIRLLVPIRKGTNLNVPGLHMAVTMNGGMAKVVACASIAEQMEMRKCTTTV